MLSKAHLRAQAFLCLFLSSGNANAQEKSIAVAGWPLDLSHMEQAVLSRDALMGTLVCPTLTRLNLLKEKSEPRLLNSVQVSGREWTLSLKPGLQWWDGRAVTTKDLENFLNQELPPLVMALGKGAWELPGFAVQAGEKELKLRWDKEPVFGPYVLNRLPFHTTQPGALGLQCAGLLQPKKTDKGWTLEGSKKAKLVLVAGAPAFGKRLDGPTLNFRFAEELHPPGWERNIEESVACDRPLDIPKFTLMAWNPEGRWTKDEKFRKAMTHLLPRGPILRAGAGALGDLVSAPLLRAHPGYRKSLGVLPYDPKKADSILNQLGYIRSDADGMRRTPDGQILQLKLAVPEAASSGLLRKVIDDSFRALGISTHFVESLDASVAGILAGVDGSWPEADLADLLRSGSKRWPWTYGDQELDKALDAYALSLTQEKPDFRLLEKVHDLVYKREPFTVLVQHRVCVDAQLGKGKTEKILARNPEWFRELLDM